MPDSLINGLMSAIRNRILSRRMPNPMHSTQRRATERSGRRRWRVVVPRICVGLIIASILFITWYSYQSNRQVVLELSDDLLDSVEQRIESEVEAYFRPASANAQLAARLGGTEALKMEANPRVTAFSVEVLRQHAQLAMVNIGDANGNFMMPKKMPDGAIDTKIIDRSTDEPTVRWIHRDPAGQVVDVEKVEYKGYDPRIRPWYRGASETGGLFWTDVYIFFTDRLPGMTAAYPIRGDDGATLGVVGIDIELDKLCDFLANLEIGRTGRAMIIDNRGMLIAYPDVDRISKMEGESIRPVSVNELGDPALTRAYSRFQVEDHGRREVEVDGARYITTVKPLTRVGREWSIMIVVPEEDFLGLIRLNKQMAVAMSIVVVALGLVLAALLMTQGVRADQNAALVKRGQDQLETRSRAFSGMIASVADREREPTTVIREMTELAAEGAGVQRVSVWRHEMGSGSLRCVDSFERGGGHSDGSELQAGEHPGLLAAIKAGEAVEAIRDDDRFSELVHNYLEPLGIRSVLMVPVSAGGSPRVWVWFERTDDDQDVSPDDRAYADAIAGMLALGCGELHGIGRAPELTKPAEADVAAAPSAVIEPELEVDRDGARPIDEEQSTAAVRRSLSPARSVTIHPGSLVLAICIDDPDLLLASDGGNGRTMGDSIIRRIERAVEADEVTHWMAAGSTLCCVALADAVSADSVDLADALARLAMDLRRDVAERIGTSVEQAPVRFAIERGSVGVTQSDESARGLPVAGRAIAAAIALARSAPAGAIHLSSTAEQALEANFVCRERGLYFVDGVGELQTFVLVGRLRQ